GTTVKSVLPKDTPVTALAPVITHNGAAISPESGTAQDFSNPVTYTVTATDGTIEKHTVTVKVLNDEEMANANLSVLKVKKGKLQPALNDSIKDYLDAPIPFSDSANPAYNAKQSNSIKADPEILIATITINGVAVENAEEYLISNLAVGTNTITIKVTAVDGTSRNYSVNMYRAIPIFKTGAGSISGYDLNSHEDGATQRGVSWPNPRFNKNSDGTVTDLMTELTWKTSNNLISNFNNAVDLSLDEKYRLPNLREMRSLANYSSGGNDYLSGMFSNYNKNNVYWTSTHSIADNGDGYYFNFKNNISSTDGKEKNYFYWQIKRESKNLPTTGQTYTELDGDDGKLQKCVVWPTPRFYTDESKAVVDNMTSLMWFSNFIEPVLSGSTDKWGQSLTYITKKINNGIPKNYGYTDWTLPNINEIESLTNYDYEKLDWLQSFITYQNQFLWTSTSSSGNNAYSFIPNSQKIEITDKDTFYYILPVRQAKIINY
nr:DUF1566 domain-containing protein [Spirochaetota bacterium]